MYLRLFVPLIRMYRYDERVSLLFREWDGAGEH